MKTVRDLFILLFGVSLPLLLLFGIWGIANYPRYYADPPLYDLIYMTNKYPHDGVKVEVIDNKIHLWVTEEAIRKNLPIPRFYRFNSKTELESEIKIPSLSKLVTPAGTGKKKDDTIDENQQKEVIIPEFKNIAVDTNITSRDGYKVEMSRPMNGIVNLFMINDYKNSLVMRKKLNTILVVREGEDDANTIRFLGWVISK